MNSTETLDKIKTRGHWVVRFEPSNYSKTRIAEYSDLAGIIRQSSVQSPGRECPWFKEDILQRGVDFVQSSLDRDVIKEFWRFYQSGLFVSWSAIWSEWRDESGMWPKTVGWRPGESLSVADAIVRYSEIFEFLGRLASKVAPNENVRLSVTVSKLENRFLESGTNEIERFLSGLNGKRWKADIPEFPFKRDLSQLELATGFEKLAEGAATQLFAHFGFPVQPLFIQEIRQRVRH